MPNGSNLQQDLIKLSSILVNLNQYELGWLYSETGHVAGKHKPEVREEIQRRLDHAVGGMSVVYLFALFETYFPKSEWRIIEPSDLERLHAFRHIRHSAAHGFEGARATTHATDFDNVMSSNNPIRSVKNYDVNNISLHRDAGIDLREFLEFITKKYLVRV